MEESGGRKHFGYEMAVHTYLKSTVNFLRFAGKFLQDTQSLFLKTTHSYIYVHIIYAFNKQIYIYVLHVHICM